MKTLFLMRHAKALSDAPGIPDFDRPLIEKGLRRTRLMLEFMHEKGAIVDDILTSPSLRTMDTAKLVAEGLGLKPDKVHQELSMYSSDLGRLEELLYSEIYPADNILMIGHNPSITELANRFLEKKIEALPTSGMVGFDFDVSSWKDVFIVNPRLRFLVYPKMFEKIF